MHEQKQTSVLADMRGLFALLQWWAQIHAFPCEALLRKWGTFGSRYVGLPALMAIPYIVIFCAFLPIGPRTPQPVKHEPFGYQQYDFAPQTAPAKPPEDFSFGLLGPAGVFLFLGLYLLALFVHRIRSIQLKAQGYECHSRFIGESRFGKGEAAVCSCIGLMAIPLCIPVGIYMVAGGFAMACNETIISLHDNARVRAIKDSRIESRYYADRLKEEEE